MSISHDVLSEAFNAAYGRRYSERWHFSVLEYRARRAIQHAPSYGLRPGARRALDQCGTAHPAGSLNDRTINGIHRPVAVAVGRRVGDAVRDEMKDMEGAP